MYVLLSSLALFLTDFIFIHWAGLQNKFPRLIWTPFFQTLLICFLLSLSFSSKAYFRWMRVLLTFSFLQWLCLSYYGSYLSPMMIYLFFREIKEVFESSLGAGPVIVKPLLLWILSLFLIKKIQNVTADKAIFLKSKMGVRGQQILRFLIVFSLIYPIPRTFFTGHTFGKQAKVQDLSYINFYGALSYFFGRVFPSKVISHAFGKAKSDPRLNSSNSNHNISPKIRETQPNRHVVFILGESLSMRHLPLFGYAKPITPRLSELFIKNKLLIKKGVSGGVSTDVSIPMLIHVTSGEEAATIVAEQVQCLFKLAKTNGFYTSFISVQTQENLQHISNYFCNNYLDYYKVGDNEKTINGESAILDEELLNEVKALDWQKPQFTILHQRGSHSPYEMRYPEGRVFQEVHAEDPWEVKQIKHYDNSVYYTDKVLVELIEWIRAQSKIPVEVVFTSDHGEALGEDQQWGHVILHPVVGEVPIFYFPGSEIFKEAFREQGEWVTHKRFSTFVAQLLGYYWSHELSINKESESFFTVMGADLDGLGGEMKLISGSDGNGLVRFQE